MKKRGLSDVITTLIIVLLSLVAIGIVWVVISNIIKSGEQQTSFQFGTLFLDLQLEKVVVNPNGDVSVTVERGVGEGDLAGVAFVFSDGTKSVTVKKDAVISELGSQVFTFTPAELQELAFVKQVEIAPILTSNDKEQIGRAVDMEKSDYYSSCKTILDSGNAKGDGTYTIDTDGLGSASFFQVYCDMTTDGGGWTLVWSNLRGGTGKPLTGISWNTAINTIPKYSGTFGSNLEQFNFYLGLKYWNFLGSQIRYDWANDYGSSIDQRFYADYVLNENNNYALTLSNYQTKIGGTNVAGIYTTHNNAQFTTYDADHDIHSGNCGTFYSNTPFWYTSCWSGNINGGGENSGSGYYNGAYWYSSSKSWGTDAGSGAGNGWIFVR